MELKIKKLTKEMSEDYLSYFDHVAFTDHEEWSACYCLESHLKKEEEEQYKTKEERRQKAKVLIENGTMQGYLIYENEDIVGWCNTDDKMSYVPICENDEFITDNREKGKIKVLYCIDIAPAYRGKGIANQIMKKVCEDAKAEGYLIVEGFPFKDTNLPYQYRGPIHLYEKHGFEKLKEGPWYYIMRKDL